MSEIKERLHWVSALMLLHRLWVLSSLNCWNFLIHQVSHCKNGLQPVHLGTYTPYPFVSPGATSGGATETEARTASNGRYTSYWNVVWLHRIFCHWTQYQVKLKKDKHWTYMKHYSSATRLAQGNWSRITSIFGRGRKNQDWMTWLRFL